MTNDYRKRAGIAEQENARLREELNRRPKYEWFVDQARKALKQADTVPPQQLIPQIRQLKEASEQRKKNMRNQPDIPIDTVVEWHYNHWDNDEWSASQGVLKYQKGNFILIELDGKPTVLDGKDLVMRPYKERPETKFFKKVFASGS